MLNRFLAKLRGTAGKGTGTLDPNVAKQAARRVANLQRPVSVAIAALSPTLRHAAYDALEAVIKLGFVARLEDAEALTAELQLHDVDLVVLDLALIADPATGLALWARIERARPRLAVVAITEGSGASAQRVSPEALAALKATAEARSDVSAVLDADADDFLACLAEVTIEAAEAREKRQVAASEAFEAAQRRVETHPATGAKGLIEAYQTGDLTSAALAQLRGVLLALVERLPEHAPERADALAVLAADAFERHDEINLIFHATRLQEAIPERTPEAESWLSRTDELVMAQYAVIDRQLEYVMVQRRIGRFRQVLRQCQNIHARLGNILPAYALEAEALRSEGDLAGAIRAYNQLTDLSLLNGEVDRAHGYLRLIETLDPTGEAVGRVAAQRAAIAQIEDSLADPDAMPRYPCLCVCSRVMCQEAAETSHGFYVTTRDGTCDICDLGVLGRIDALHGTTIAIIGGRLGRFYEAALKELGAARVLHHDAITEPATVPGLVVQADAVVLVAGAGTHWGLLKAERELARMPRPSVRVHFYGVRQVARAVALDLASRLMEVGGTGALTSRR